MLQISQFLLVILKLGSTTQFDRNFGISVAIRLECLLFPTAIARHRQRMSCFHRSEAFPYRNQLRLPRDCPDSLEIIEIKSEWNEKRLYDPPGPTALIFSLCRGIIR